MAEDDLFYSRVAEELEQNAIDKGLWTRAMAASGGSADATRSLYIRYRVRQLKKEVTAQINATSNTLKDAIDKGVVTCPACNHTGAPQRVPKGDISTGCILSFFFLIPGLVYFLLYNGYKYICPKCKGTLYRDVLRVS